MDAFGHDIQFLSFGADIKRVSAALVQAGFMAEQSSC